MIVLLENGCVTYCGNYEGFEEQLQLSNVTETDTLLLSDVSTGDMEGKLSHNTTTESGCNVIYPKTLSQTCNSS